MAIDCGTDSIRDVIASPKTQRAQDLMTLTPSRVTPDQLKELKLKLNVTYPPGPGANGNSVNLLRSSPLSQRPEMPHS